MTDLPGFVGLVGTPQFVQANCRYRLEAQRLFRFRPATYNAEHSNGYPCLDSHPANQTQPSARRGPPWPAVARDGPPWPAMAARSVRVVCPDGNHLGPARHLACERLPVKGISRLQALKTGAILGRSGQERLHASECHADVSRARMGCGRRLPNPVGPFSTESPPASVLRGKIV